MVGGDLHWIWEPYGLYQEIDYVRHISPVECAWGANYDQHWDWRNRSTASRLCKKIVDSLALNASLRSSRWSLDRKVLT